MSMTITQAITLVGNAVSARSVRAGGLVAGVATSAVRRAAVLLDAWTGDEPRAAKDCEQSGTTRDARV